MKLKLSLTEICTKLGKFWVKKLYNYIFEKQNNKYRKGSERKLKLYDLHDQTYYKRQYTHYPIIVHTHK